MNNKGMSRRRTVMRLIEERVDEQLTRGLGQKKVYGSLKIYFTLHRCNFNSVTIFCFVFVIRI